MGGDQKQTAIIALLLVVILLEAYIIIFSSVPSRQMGMPPTEIGTQARQGPGGMMPGWGPGGMAPGGGGAPGGPAASEGSTLYLTSTSKGTLTMKQIASGIIRLMDDPFFPITKKQAIKILPLLKESAKLDAEIQEDIRLFEDILTFTQFSYMRASRFQGAQDLGLPARSSASLTSDVEKLKACLKTFQGAGIPSSPPGATEPPSPEQAKTPAPVPGTEEKTGPGQNQEPSGKPGKSQGGEQ